ncbi:MAG TPA: RsmD family RNA methyltransferase, partial [Thermoplasmata archaeon]|nr:RsmD family RNA methyltransferase [Thermoplasmata archaeon]
QTELGVETVLQHAGRTEGEDRRPRVEVIAGTETETTVRENGVVYRFDAARQMFAAGNRTERRRAGEVTRPEDTVVDLFAGIGYFALPAARYGRARRVLAVERNEEAFGFLMENVRRNGVVGRVEAILGDNRSATLPHVEADRVFMGYLPSAVPWIPRALELTRPGATLHVHLVGPTHAGPDGASDTVRTAVHRAGASVRGATAREVKPYGPGTAHYVVDVSVGEAD